MGPAGGGCGNPVYLGMVVSSRGACPKMSKIFNSLPRQTGKLRPRCMLIMHWVGLVLHWEAAPRAAEETFVKSVSWSTRQRVGSVVVRVSCHMS